MKSTWFVMPMYNFIEYSYTYSGTTGNLLQHHKKNDRKYPVADSNLFKVKARFLANTNEQGIINAEITVQLKYLNNFWRALEMSLINCGINLILNWSEAVSLL